MNESASDAHENGRDPGSDESLPIAGIGFLLTQIGTRAAMGFAERLEPLGLSPPQAGILRRVAARPGESQRSLADALGTHASRLVAIVDDLEERGLIERRRDPEDRRNNLITLSEEGRGTLAQIAKVSREHEKAITAELTDRQRSQLAKSLTTIAEDMDLTPGVHPGYRRLGRPGTEECR